MTAFLSFLLGVGLILGLAVVLFGCLVWALLRE